MVTTLILVILAIGMGIAAGFLAAHAKTAANVAKLQMLEQENDSLKNHCQQLEQTQTALKDEKADLCAQRDVATQQAETLRQRVEELKAYSEQRLEEARKQAAQAIEQQRNDYEQRLEELKADHEKTLNAQKANAEQQRQQMEQHYQQQFETFRTQQKDQMSQQSNLIREQINAASEQILKKRSEELGTANREQLAAILNPLQDNLRQMKEAVEKNDRNQTTSMERLDASIKENLRQAQQVGERADKLAQALTSENKTQGNFGELRLRTLLENMGLEEGVQFEEQVTMKDNGTTLLSDEGGHRLVPDVILHFPGNRDVIIDSKMSLKAFEDYYNATTDAERTDALARHITSVRNHVKELAHKNYSSYIANGHHKLDFVLMYVYSESALQLALANDPGLWKEAYDDGVVISGSQNLYMMLRVLEMTWRQVRQAENQEAMMRAANELVNRVGMFYDRFLAVDDQLDKTRKAFDSLKTSTAPTGKSIVSAANTLIKFGAQENPKRKHRLPKADGGDSNTDTDKEEDQA